jgi:peptidoglycan hydrolase-like protein with peptidoglycan-binding domain
MLRILLVICVSIVLATVAFAQGTSPSASTSPAATAKSGKRPPIFRPTKDQIKQVQAMLKDKKMYDGEASGTYNDPTRTGIKGFQKGNGLKETGTLNRATLEKMGVELTDAQKLIPVSQNSFAEPATEGTKSGTKPAASKTEKSAGMVSEGGTASNATNSGKKPVIFRATVDQIKAAQKMLKSKSMYAGDESGKLDDATRDGLKKFQEAGGVKVTGTLNAATLEALGIPLTDKQKADAASAPAPKP